MRNQQAQAMAALLWSALMAPPLLSAWIMANISLVAYVQWQTLLTQAFCLITRSTKMFRALFPGLPVARCQEPLLVQLLPLMFTAEFPVGKAE